MEETGGLTAIRDLPPTPQAPVEPVPPNGAGPPRERRPKRWYLIGAAIAVVLFSGAAVGAHLILSSSYSSQRAVVDYLHAQARGDVNGMWQNGLFQGGEGSYHVFFSKGALEAMMNDPANSLLSNVKVTSTRELDANTDLVTASLNWYGSNRSIDFRVVKDTSRMHWLLYPSWRVVAPTAALNISYPKQGGGITIDGLTVPDSSGSAIEVISGGHHAKMAGTDIVAEEIHTVDAGVPSSAASVEFHDVLTAAASKAAADSVRQAFAGCDASKDEGCPEHRYTAPNDGYRYYLVAPDGSHAFYTHYIIHLVGDPTTTMQTVFETTDGQLSVSGSCTTKLTTDSRSFDHGGTFTGKLTWNGNSFDSHVTWTC